MPSTLYFIIEPSVRMVLLDLCLWKSFCSDAVCKNKIKHAVSKKLKAKLYKKEKKYRCLNICMEIYNSNEDSICKSSMYMLFLWHGCPFDTSTCKGMHIFMGSKWNLSSPPTWPYVELICVIWYSYKNY